MALRTPEKNEPSPVKNIGDEHWKKQEARFRPGRGRQQEPAGDDSDPRGEGSDKLDAPGDIANRERQAADESGERLSRFDDDLGTQESRGVDGARYRDHFTGDSSTPTGLRTKLSKPRNLAFILGTSFAGIGLFFTVLLTPAFALIGLKETILDKFDDRMSTLHDKRNIRLLNKKLTGNPLTAGCNIAPVKCRFKGMSKTEVKKFEKRNAGSKVNVGGCIGAGSVSKCRVTSIEFNDSDGKRKTVTPGQFKNTLKTNREFRSHVAAYNKSKVANFRDKQFGKLATKLGLFLGKHRSNKPPPGTGTDEERKKAADDKKAKDTAAKADSDGKKNEIKSKFGVGLTAIGVACVAKTLINGSQDLAKAELVLKLIPLAVLLVNAADDLKNGTADGEKGSVNHISEVGETLVNKDENGETAFDSYGWQYAAYGVIDEKNQDSAKEFQMGAGANQSTFAEIVKKSGSVEVINALDKFGLDALCKVFENSLVGILVCSAATILSGGAAGAFCAAQAVAGAVLVPLILPILFKALVKTVDTSSLIGGKAANAAIGGFSALTSLNSRHRGAYPLKKDQAVQFDKFSDNAQGGGAWVGKDAYLDDNPFERFSHKLAVQFLPSLSKMSSLSSLPTALAGVSSTGMSSLATSAQARTTIKAEYDQCVDDEYQSLGLATDPFCVPQYGFDPSLMLGDNQFNSSGGAADINDTRGFAPDNRYDADAVIDFMLNTKPWIDGEGEGKDYTEPDPDAEKDYPEYVKNCIENTDPIGADTPEMCKPKDCKSAGTGSDQFRYCMFSVYASDTSLFDQYEDNDADLASGGAGVGGDSPPGGAAGAEVNIADLGKSSDTLECAAGTTDRGVVTSKYSGEFKKESGPLKIRLCQVSDIGGDAVVEARVSGAWAALAKKAKTDGVNLISSSSFRLEDSCGGTGDGTGCARPGQSAHQTGWAIDFANVGGFTPTGSYTSCSGRMTNGSAEWKWLKQNAEDFGIKQYSAESWHWDLLPMANRCGK